MAQLSSLASYVSPTSGSCSSSPSSAHVRATAHASALSIRGHTLPSPWRPISTYKRHHCHPFARNPSSTALPVLQPCDDTGRHSHLSRATTPSSPGTVLLCSISDGGSRLPPTGASLPVSQRSTVVARAVAATSIHRGTSPPGEADTTTSFTKPRYTQSIESCRRSNAKST